MKTLLIGISAPINKASRDAISVFTEEFNLEHINLRQPVINMVAALTNMHPTHQEFCCESHQVIDDLGISIAELEISIAFSLRTFNHRFFIERASASVKKSAMPPYGAPMRPAFKNPFQKIKFCTEPAGRGGVNFQPGLRVSAIFRGGVILWETFARVTPCADMHAGTSEWQTLKSS